MEGRGSGDARRVRGQLPPGARDRGGAPKEGGSSQGVDKYDICSRAPETLAPPLGRGGRERKLTSSLFRHVGHRAAFECFESIAYIGSTLHLTGVMKIRKRALTLPHMA